MRILILALLTFVFLGACAGSPRRVTNVDETRLRELRRVAVLPLENLTNEPAAARIVADMLGNALYRTGRFDVIERGEALRILTAANQTPQLFIDRSLALEYARLLRVDAVLLGTLTEYGHIVDHVNSRRETVVGLHLRLVETREGRVVWSGLINRTSADVLFLADEPMAAIARMAVNDVAVALTPPLGVGAQ